jgi:hypothetical protein
MKIRAILFTLSVIVIAGTTGAGEVYMTRDSKGQPVYTDKPDQLPAEKLSIKSRDTDEAAVQARYEAGLQSVDENTAAAAEAREQKVAGRKAEQSEAADLAARCEEARNNYQEMMRARRIYEPGASDDERRYLDNEEITSARQDAKDLMDEFCGQR